MGILRNVNAPPLADLVQTYLDSSYDIVKAVYLALGDITTVAGAIDDLSLDDYVKAEDLDSLSKLNALVIDATLGNAADFATAAQGILADGAVAGPLASQVDAETGAENTLACTSLRVKQAIDAQVVPKLNNWVATTAPTVNNDQTEGYQPGSIWVDITGNLGYQCVSAGTGAALWYLITLTPISQGDAEAGSATALQAFTAQRVSQAITALAPAATASSIVNVQTGTSYEIAGSDNGKEIIFTNAGAIAVTLPDTLDTLFQCVVKQAGAGVPTVTPDTDTINGAGAGITPSAQWKALHLVQYQATLWFGLA